MVKTCYAEHTGGGCMVDFVELHDGRLVGINHETIVLYPSVDAFWRVGRESCENLKKIDVTT